MLSRINDATSNGWFWGGVNVQPRGARSDPRRGLHSVGSRAGQHFLHPGAGLGVALHYLLDVLLFLPLQDAQEVLQLRHGEGVPLEEKNSRDELKMKKTL